VASAGHLSAIGGFVVLAVFLAPLWRGLAPACKRGWRAPAAWARLVVVSVTTGAVMRIASRCLALASLFLGRDPATTAPFGPVIRWQCPAPGHVLLSLVTLAVLTPFVEETVSRGLILSELKARCVPFAISISAALFAVFHVPGTIPMAFLFGVVAANLVIRQGTLWGAFLAHATFNALIVIDSMCLRLEWQPSTPVPVGLLLLSAAAALVLLAFTLARAGDAGPAGPGRPSGAS